MALEAQWENLILLSGIVFLPAMVALGLLLVPKRWTGLIKSLSLAATLLVFLATLYLAYWAGGGGAFGEKATPSGPGKGFPDFVVRLPWTPAFGVEYFLGVDGISLPLVLLTSLLSLLAMLASWKIDRHEKAYCVLFLLLETGLLGVFLALDLFLFYVFWEVTLLPMYFLIGLWGGPRREYAAVKFFLFTLAGSVLMLVAMLMLYFASDLRLLSPGELAACHAGPTWPTPNDVQTESAKPAPFSDRSGESSATFPGKWTPESANRRFSERSENTSAPASEPARHTFNLLALAALGQGRNLKKPPFSDTSSQADRQETQGKTLPPDDAALGLGPLDRPLLWGKSIQWWAFLLLLVGFLVKVPSVPVHTWLPDAHVEAPTPISMLLAGVLLKMGGYGLLRIAYPICPAGAYELAWLVCGLGLVSMIYGAFASLAQKDFKRLVAYSSVSHMGYVLLGLGVWSATAARSYQIDAWLMGASGAMFQMIAHGITSAGMFFLVGVIYDRVHHRQLDQMGGLLHRMPSFGAVSIVIFFGAMGLPGLCGFVGEVLVLLGAWHYSAWMAALGASVVILTAGYILWTIQRVYLGAEYRGPHAEALQPMTRREMAVALPLAVLAVVLGVYPQVVFSYAEPSVRQTIQQLADWTRRHEAARPSAATSENPTVIPAGRLFQGSILQPSATNSENPSPTQNVPFPSNGAESSLGIPTRVRNLWTLNQFPAEKGITLHCRLRRNDYHPL